MPRISYTTEYKNLNGECKKSTTNVYLPERVFYSGEIYEWDSQVNKYVNLKGTRVVSGEDIAKSISSQEEKSL